MKKSLGHRGPEITVLPKVAQASVNGLIPEYRPPDCHPMLFSPEHRCPLPRRGRGLVHGSLHSALMGTER